MNQQIVFLQHPKQTKYYVGQIERQSPRWTGLILFFFLLQSKQIVGCVQVRKKISNNKTTIYSYFRSLHPVWYVAGGGGGGCLCVATVVVCI